MSNALVNGGEGGIGKAIEDKLASEGECVFINDISEERKKETLKEFKKDVASGSVIDVTKDNSIRQAFEKSCLAFGFFDIIVNCSGLSISKPLEKTT